MREIVSYLACYIVLKLLDASAAPELLPHHELPGDTFADQVPF